MDLRTCVTLTPAHLCNNRASTGPEVFPAREQTSVFAISETTLKIIIFCNKVERLEIDISHNHKKSESGPIIMITIDHEIN